MSETNDAPRLNLGAVALAAMGWLELTVSLIMFLLDVDFAAIAFAVASLFLSFIAAAVRSQRGTQRTGNRTVFMIIGAMSIGLLIGAVIFLIRADYLSAVLFAMWSVATAMLALRQR
jgi:hypothetical protein